MPSRLNPDLGHLTARMRAARPSLSRSRGGSKRAPAGATVIGLDIDPGHVVAAEVSINGGLSVRRAAAATLAPGVVRDGEVIEVDALSETLRTLFAENKLGRRVRLGLANQRIMVRTMELPHLPDRGDFAAAVRFGAQDEIPMPLDSVVLDFHSLGIVETPGGPRERVLLVAARPDMVDRLLAAVNAAGLRAEGVDLSAFALIRALLPPGADPSERVLYLSVGGLTNLALAEGQKCLFTRILGGGLETMAAAVAERCVMPVLEARTLLRDTGLTDSGGPADAAEVSCAAPDASEARAAPEAIATAENVLAPSTLIARQVLSDGVRQIATEVRNSLDYHLALGPGSSVGRVVAAGTALEIPGFRDTLESEIGLPVTLGEVAESSPGAAGGMPLSRLAVATGLAVAEVAP